MEECCAGGTHGEGPHTFQAHQVSIDDGKVIGMFFPGLKNNGPLLTDTTDSIRVSQVCCYLKLSARCFWPNETSVM